MIPACQKEYKTFKTAHTKQVKTQFKEEFSKNPKSSLIKPIDPSELQNKLDFINFKRLEREGLVEKDSDTSSQDSQINYNSTFSYEDGIIDRKLIEILNDFIAVPHQNEYFHLFNISEFGD